MATKTRPAPPLRPSITALVPSSYVPTGSTAQTVGEFIVAQINAGVDPITAAGTVGVTKQEFDAWMREGVIGFSRLDAGAVWETDFSAEQQDAIVFADATLRAHAAHISRLSVVAEQAARGQLPAKVTTRTKTDQAGAVLERMTISETMLPDLDMVRWKLEKLEPGIYGSKASLSITVADLTDTDAVVDIVEQRMREIADQFKAKAIETTATEQGDSDGSAEGVSAAAGGDRSEAGRVVPAVSARSKRSRPTSDR